MPDSPEFLLSSFFATLDFCHLFLKGVCILHLVMYGNGRCCLIYVGYVRASVGKGGRGRGVLYELSVLQFSSQDYCERCFCFCFCSCLLFCFYLLSCFFSFFFTYIYI